MPRFASVPLADLLGPALPPLPVFDLAALPSNASRHPQNALQKRFAEDDDWFGHDVDDLFSYKTAKVVRIRDRYLGPWRASIVPPVR